MPAPYTFTYGSPSSGTTYLWSVGSNWNTGSAPRPDTAITIGTPSISGAVTLDDNTNFTITTLTIDAGGVVEIANGNSLSLTGQLSGPGQVDLVGANSGISIGTAVPFSPNANLQFDGVARSVSLGERLTLTGLGTSGTDSGIVSGFAAGDQIDFRDFTSISSVTLVGSTLTVNGTTSGGASTYQFTNFSTATSGEHFVTTSDGGTGTLLEATTCFAAGTRLLTDSGERAVEDLAEGDCVMALRGDSQVLLPITWVGRLRVNLTRHPRPESAAPIRIRRGAFADNVPHRDLLLSPEHCVFVDGGLVAAKCLVNGMTIVQDLDRPAIEYFHIETTPHAVVLAEGLPTETYLDTGNRAFFDNAGLALMLHPEFHVNASLRCWATDACASLATDPAELEPIWRRLVDRATAIGHRRDEPTTTTQAAPRLLVNGRELTPVEADGHRAVFVLPRGAAEATLLSRVGFPADRAPYLNDHRRLGVAVARIVLRAGTENRVIPADYPALVQGWHPVERNAAEVWRWTDGRARIPLDGVQGPATLELHMTGAMTYRLDDQEGRRHAA